jgi:hypothetical protein
VPDEEEVIAIAFCDAFENVIVVDNEVAAAYVESDALVAVIKHVPAPFGDKVPALNTQVVVPAEYE